MNELEFPESFNAHTPLFALQEKALTALKGHYGPFCLTGGLALAIFYLHHRQSSDIDLITNRDPTYADSAEKIAAILQKEFGSNLSRVTCYKDFTRFEITGKAVLKIELINDIRYRWLQPPSVEGIPLDALGNILVNKLNCIHERDESADLVDLAEIASSFSFNWPDIITSARRKSMLSQAFVLQKICRKAETLRAMLRGMEPSNIFELLKMPPLLNLDYRVVFVNVTGKEEKIEPNDVPSFTLDDFINRLDTVAEKLTVLAYRNDPAALREQNDIPLRLFLHWGGATVSIRRTEITSSFHLIKRIENHLESRFLDENRVTGALSPGQLSEKLTRIINDIQGSGVNSAGAGKTLLTHAVSH